ncbi:MAG: dihydrofolate reductase [Eubacteriales bacterium]|nr:dihydrofolate reductase [Eubacteriales bacterium]
MKAIVNVNEEWGIGCEGDLLEYIPEDMKFFRNETKGKTVIMGRKTLLGFPNKAPLKGRTNIVLTSSSDNIPEESKSALMSEAYMGSNTSLIVVNSVDELIRKLEELECEDPYVIGGEKIYRLLLPYCEECLVTINNSKRKADTYFPNLFEEGFTMTNESDKHEYEGISYRFTVFERKSRLA